MFHAPVSIAFLRFFFIDFSHSTRGTGLKFSAMMFDHVPDMVIMELPVI